MAVRFNESNRTKIARIVPRVLPGKGLAQDLSNRARVPATRLLADRQRRPDAMPTHVAEGHGPDLIAFSIVGAARVAARAGQKLHRMSVLSTTQRCYVDVSEERRVG